MKSVVNSVRITIIISLALCLIYFLSSGTNSTENTDYYDSQRLDITNSDITGHTVRKRRLVIKVVQSGTLKALRSLMFSSEIKSNRAKLIYIVNEGSFVNKGDILFRFDPTPFTDYIEELKTGLLEAQTNLVRAEEELEYNKTKYNEDLNSAKQKLEVSQMRLKNVKEGDGVLKLEKAKSKIKDAELSLKEAEISFENSKKMLEKGFVTKMDVDRADSKLKQAGDSLYFAKKEYDTLLNYSYPIELKEAGNEVEKALDYLDKLEKKNLHEENGIKAKIQHAENRVRSVENQIKSAQAELEKTDVASPISGFVVYSKNYFGGKLRGVQLGDAIWSNQDVMMIPDTSKMLVDTRIREADIYKVREGQDVDVKVDAYPGLELKGKVTLIGVLAQSDSMMSDSMQKYFGLEVEIINGDERLRPGMTARVEIISRVIEDALCIPLQAVVTEDNRRYCYLKDGNAFKRVEIIIGGSNEEYAEVSDGLQEGNTVYLPDDIELLQADEKKGGFSFVNALNSIFSKDQ